jgi:hypothetical protein
LTTISVTGTYVDASGTAQQGSVSFTPTATVMDASGKAALTMTAVVAILNSSGSFSVTLPCTDNPALPTPAAWGYTVAVNVPGAQQTFTTSLPSAFGSTVDITALAPVTGAPAPLGIWYLPNTQVPPSTAPSLGGGFLYCQNGALYWFGSSGTRTKIASA